MSDDPWPVDWIGSHTAVLALPQRIRESDSGRLRDELASIIDEGATEVIVDMTSTTSCDHAAADALGLAYHHALVNGTQLRLVVVAQIVRRTLSLSGLDRLAPVYPSLEAALAAGTPSMVIPLAPRHRGAPKGQQAGAMRNRSGEREEPGPRQSVITPAVLWQVVDALDDGVALVYDDGALALVNRRLEEMFGYERAELIDQPVELLMPAAMRAAHRRHRRRYAQDPQARPMAARARLVGFRKDGTSIPVRVSLAPVPTATGRFTLAVIRDATADLSRADLADLARATLAEQVHHGRQLLSRVTSGLFRVGDSLQRAADLPSETARQHIGEALQHLDDTIREIRDHVFGAGEPPPADPGSRGDG